MRRPSRVYIYGLPYTIQFIKDLKDEQNNWIFGQCCYSEAWIKINTATPIEHQRSTLWHEIAHIRLRQVPHLVPDTRDQEEALVRVDEISGFTLLADPRNRAVMEFLLGCKLIPQKD